MAGPGPRDGAGSGGAGVLMVGLLLCLVLSRSIALLILPVFDDAFITFRYARNLVAGLGFVYNPGEWVLGTTAPLWGLLSSAVLGLGGSPPLVIPLVNIALDLAVVTLAWRLVFRGDALGLGLFVSCLVASPMLARVTVGGMESNLFMTVTLGAFLLYERGLRFAAVALAATSYFLRPEGLATVGVLCLAELAFARRPVRAVAMGALATVVLGPTLWLARVVYGSALSQSVVTKARYPRRAVSEVLGALLAPEPVSAAIAMVGLVGLVVALRRGGGPRLLALWYVAYLAAYLVKGPKVWTWYGFPLICLSALFAARLGSRLLSIARPAWPRVLGPATAAAAVAFLAVYWIAIGVSRYPDRVTRNIYHPVESFCREVRASDTITAADIGVIGYHCPAIIYDLEGLVWPAWRDYSTLSDLAVRLKPTYLFLTIGPGTLSGMAREPLASLYAPVRRFAPDGDPDPLKATKVTGDWAQQYVLFRRLAPEPGRRDTPGSRADAAGRSPSRPSRYP